MSESEEAKLEERIRTKISSPVMENYQRQNTPSQMKMAPPSCTGDIIWSRGIEVPPDHESVSAVNHNS